MNFLRLYSSLDYLFKNFLINSEKDFTIEKNLDSRLSIEILFLMILDELIKNDFRELSEFS